MPAVRIWSYIEVDDAFGVTHKLGDPPADTPRQFSIDGDVHDKTYSVANGSTQKLYDVDDDIGDFDVLAIVSTQNLLLQIVIDDDGDNGESYQVHTLRAYIPFLLGTDDGLASDGSVDLFDGTADLVERINCKNSSGSAADVRILAGT